MAERQGFEPWIPFRVYTLSKRAPSATRPSLRRESVLRKYLTTLRTRTKSLCAAQSAQHTSIVAYWGVISDGENGALHGPFPLGLPPLIFFFQLLRQVICDSHLADGVQLRSQPVDVVLFVIEDLLRKIARAVIASGHTQLDALIQPLHGVVFEIEIVLDLGLDGRSDVDFEVVGHVRSALEI